MALTEEQLLDLKGEIDTAKTKVAELTGTRKTLMAQLKETWGCKTVEEADKKLKTLGEEINQLEASIKEQTEDLEKKWIEKEG